MIKVISILVGLAILGCAKPTFADSPAVETFHGPKGDYYRIPPGYLWTNENYNFTLLIPEGAEGCTDNGILSSHGFAIGPSGVPCLDVFKHPAAGIYAGYTIAYSEPVRKQALIQEICKNRTNRPKKTNIWVGDYQFYRCWRGADQLDANSRYMDYFILSEPNPGIELSVYIFCPETGNCHHWIRKWEKLIFNNLSIHWSDDDASETIGSKGDGKNK